MSNLKKSLAELAKNYHKLGDDDKRSFLTETYEVQQLSWAEVAKLVDSYTNKVRRDGSRLGIKTRSKSDAQALALNSGRHQHPTKGTKRSDDTKAKISNSMAKSWEELTDEQRKERSDIGKELWNKMTPQEKEQFQRKAGDAVRQASKEGSKLEKHLYTELIKEGWKVNFHTEHIVSNERLQLDLLLPELNIAIEVDGPSHFSPIWGETTLQKNQKADQQKNGLLLGRGMVVIRILHNKQPSQKSKRDITTKLIKKIREIEAKFPPVDRRFIEIGE